MSILKNIVDELNENNEKTYFPSQHKGECTEPYIVVKQEGVSPVLGVSSERPIYTIMCYVPKNKYSYLETMLRNVKATMKRLFPVVMYAGNETPSFYDDEEKSHMVSIQYYGCRKIENW